MFIETNKEDESKWKNQKGELHMRDINTVRKAVATMANLL